MLALFVLRRFGVNRSTVGRTSRRLVVFTMASVVGLGGLVVPASAQESVGRRLSGSIVGEEIRVDVDGKLFTAYRFGPNQKYPYFWPVNGPISGRSITVHKTDPYPHHSSVFFGCDHVNGANYWQEGNERGQIVSRGPRIVCGSGKRVEFTDSCVWRMPGHDPMIEESRRIVVTAPSVSLRFIDFVTEMRALEDVQFGKTNHSLFSVRVAPHMSVKGGGRLVDAYGRTGEKATFGKKAPWMDYSGDNGGAVEGIAVLDHPENPWFPSRWFTRDYGFISPTPMYWLEKHGYHLRKGDRLSLKYRVVVHAGDETQAGVDKLYRDWAGAGHIDVLPVALAFAGTPVNGGQSLLSDGRKQYIAFYDPDRRLTVGVRSLDADDWRFIRLDERVGWDSHNTIAMTLDRNGHIHLTANHHGSDLNYFRTKRPGDIDTFERIDRFGKTRETRVTYPRFFAIPPDGRLGVMYRHGSSGDGERLLLEYDEAGRTWSRATPGPILSGRPKFNAYPWPPVFDSKGRLHLAWCWRETPDVETNQDLSYAVSPDGGKTWQTSAGRPLSTPIRPGDAEVVDPIPQNGGLLNGGSLAVDHQGRPYIGYIKYGPKGATQMYIATRDERGWRIVQLSDWDFRWELRGKGSIPSAGIRIPSCSFSPDGSMRIRFAHRQTYWGPRIIRTTIEGFKASRPGSLPSEPYVSALRRAGLDYSYAVGNRGPLPAGEQHYMVQKTAPPNRDRKPENPMPPTMIYLVRIGAR